MRDPRVIIALVAFLLGSGVVTGVLRWAYQDVATRADTAERVADLRANHVADVERLTVALDRLSARVEASAATVAETRIDVRVVRTLLERGVHAPGPAAAPLPRPSWLDRIRHRIEALALAAESRDLRQTVQVQIDARSERPAAAKTARKQEGNP